MGPRYSPRPHSAKSQHLKEHVHDFPHHPEDPGYPLCWHRLSRSLHPGPASAAVFVDENEKNIQQSAFGINPPEALTMFNSSLRTWISFPGTRHNNAGTLSFADGRVKYWRWREFKLLAHSRSGQDQISMIVAAALFRI